MRRGNNARYGSTALARRRVERGGSAVGSSQGPVSVEINPAGRTDHEPSRPSALNDRPVFPHPFAALRAVGGGRVEKEDARGDEKDEHQSDPGRDSHRYRKNSAEQACEKRYEHGQPQDFYELRRDLHS